MPVQIWTTLSLLQTTAKYLGERGADSPRLAAERLLAHVLGCKRVDLYLQAERELGEPALESYRKLIRRFAAGEPLQYLVQETEFMGVPLQVDRRALIPRPETEILVDALVKRLRGRSAGNCRVLEFGVGSGAISVALATHVPEAEIWATEIDPASASLALENVRRHSLETRIHVLGMNSFEALSPHLAGAFDCIVANPPYVRTDELPRLPAVVREHEPVRALDGGADGLEFYRYLCGPGLQFLGAGGTLGVEIGATQGQAVTALFEAAALVEITLLRDYGSHDRVVLGKRA